MDEKFFDNVSSEVVTLPSGLQIKLPIRYYDTASIVGTFLAPVAKTKSVLPTERLTPVQVAPDVGAIVLVAIDYRRIDGLELYGEFAVLIPVVYDMGHGPGLPGYYFHHLPVTTPAACEAGIELWGFPKFVADIRFEDEANLRRCRLQAGGKEILTLEVQTLATAPQTWDVNCYTVKEGKLLRTVMPNQGLVGMGEDRGGATCILGDHPIAQELRALEMDTTSVKHQYRTWVQFLLPRAQQSLSLH